VSGRFLLRIFFAGSVVAALGAAAGPAFAACQVGIDAVCQWFKLDWHDTGPTAASNDLEKTLNEVQRRQTVEHLARGLAFASQCWNLIGNNPDLRAQLDKVPIAITHGDSGAIEIVRWNREPAPGSEAPLPDSLVTRIRRADRAAVGTFYTVRLGSYGSRQAVQSAALQWSFLRQGDTPSTEPALAESQLHMNWRYRSCLDAWDPDLFALPPALSESGKYDLDFRLVVDPRDASELAAILEKRLMTRTEVVPVRVTGDVLSIALAR
jgi:hypothetical protein